MTAIRATLDPMFHRFVCVGCKAKQATVEGHKLGDANRLISKAGWRILVRADAGGVAKETGLHCPFCVQMIYTDRATTEAAVAGAAAEAASEAA